MVCGVIGVSLLPTVYGMALSVLLGPAAVILGLVARRRVGRGREGAGGYALAGVVLGAVAFVVSAVVIVLVAAGILFSSGEDEEDDSDSPGIQVSQVTVRRWAGADG